MPMAARVSEEVAKHLGEGLGYLLPALTFRRPPPPVSVLRRFLEPLVNAEAILIGAAHAGEEIAEELTTRGEGVRRLRLVLFETSARGRQIEVGFSQPECDVPLLMRPLREKLMSPDLGFDFEFGIEALRLEVISAERIDPSRFSESARLVDALSGRLGGERVLRISHGDSHQPERASVLTSALEREISSVALPTTARPLLLLDQPEPIDAIATVPDGPPRQFRWRRVVRELAHAEGPERIAPDWLGPQAGGTRDYFRVEDKTGARYWLCREGLYGRETDAPRWFVHGLFP
jgi:protein ImuB